ncbi:uncharacterized protein LOC117295157 [Asterias rubens]|uniref:uncharacterized protein LOC117295157 n=1 Tax=Asterias rubens TaxID=7604 RepID=UPI001455C136|nr:uncharacterized protein LOC117295157 [Asterias rubens]XP_033633616.1 uncharacterized protein LOC117295157 [Asterias rubens]
MVLNVLPFSRVLQSYTSRPLVSLVYAVLVTTCLFRRALITVKPAQVNLTEEAMGSVSEEIVKCGYLTTAKEKLSLLKKKQKAYWKLRSHTTALECYSNERDAKPKKKIQLVNTVVYKHTSDGTVLCIRQSPGNQVRFMRAESPEQRDEWCRAIQMVICKLNGLPVEPRARAYTDTSDNRRRPNVGRSGNCPQSAAPTLEESFVAVPPHRPLPAIPAETEDDGISKLQETQFCCSRNHVVGFNKQGTNMATTDVVYENVHYVQSHDQWVMDVELRKNILSTQRDIYNGFQELDTLTNSRVHRPTSTASSSSMSSSSSEEDLGRASSEPIYEQSIPRRREPEEIDDRACEIEDLYLTACKKPEQFALNNLSKVRHQQPAVSLPCDPVNLRPRPTSLESTEDNTVDPGPMRNQKLLPELPPRKAPTPPPRQAPTLVPRRHAPTAPPRQAPPLVPRRHAPTLLQRQAPPTKPRPRLQKAHQEPPPRQEHSMPREELHQKLQTLQDEQRKQSITKTVNKQILVGNKIRLMQVKNGIWVAGWDESEPSLGSIFRVGDQLIKINKQALTSASFAHSIIDSTDDDEVIVVLKRLPRATVCPINRRTPRDELGIKLAGNEIIELHECGLVSKFGCLKPQTTGVSGDMCNWAITEVNMVPLDLFASEDSIFRTLRSGTLNELVIVVQPVDFVQKIRENMQEKVYSSAHSLKALDTIGDYSK